MVETQRPLAGFDRLTPLPEVLAALERLCVRVTPVRRPVEQAAGRIVAESLFGPADVPLEKIALREGWAVAAETTEGASAYAPCVTMEAPRRVSSGEALPEGTDAVLPLHGLRAAVPAEILCAAAPGDFVRPQGGDFREGELIAAAGKRLRPDQAALLSLAGIAEASFRVPRVAVLAPQEGGGPAGRFLAAAAGWEGARAGSEAIETADPKELAEAFLRQEADLMLILGDCRPGGALPEALRRAGTVLAHGIAVRPGEEMGCGTLPARTGEPRLAVLIPERFECVLSAWLLLARPCLRLISGAKGTEPGETLPLTRKIISNPGWADLVFLRRAAGSSKSSMWEPLAAGDIPWRSIARADAFLLVPPESEGFAAGQEVLAEKL